MARPRKLSTDEMLQIVDSYFESNGDPGRLKCSFLEEYAASQGIEAKAYDFRRNEAVRRRMDELRNSVNLDGVGVIVYKSMDIDAMLSRNRTRDMLKNSLLELDATWRRIYERAACLSQKNISLLAEILAKKQAIDALEADNDAAKAQARVFEKSANVALLENRYLKKMIKSYLYPAVANEILKNENVLEQVDTEVTQAAMDMLSEPTAPLPFSRSVVTDRQMLSREESLLHHMREQIYKHEGENDA